MNIGVPLNPMQLAQYFDDFETSLEISSAPATIEVSVEVSHQNTPLFKFVSNKPLEITSPTNLRDDLVEVIDRCGIYNLEVEFLPSMTDNMKLSGGMIQTKNGPITTKKRTDSDFRDWFDKVRSSLADKVYLIPDTNFFRRHYYSSYIKEILCRNKTRMFMRIPRLAIIEVENKFNRNKADRTSKGNLKPKDKESFDNNELEKEKERRIAFQTMAQILCIKEDGGDILQHLDMSLLQSFTPEAGKGFADAWIRKEISNNLADLRTGTYVTKPGTTLESSAEIFLTCDLMNALAGVAEGINTLYFYRIEDDGGRIKPRQGYDSLASLIVNTAIQLDECKSTILSYNKIREYHASWHGKSGFEWQNDIVHVEDLA